MGINSVQRAREAVTFARDKNFEREASTSSDTTARKSETSSSVFLSSLAVVGFSNVGAEITS
jgi:hypothetical protein